MRVCNDERKSNAVSCGVANMYKQVRCHVSNILVEVFSLYVPGIVLKRGYGWSSDVLKSWLF